MGKLICVIEMDKAGGAKVTVTDEDAKASQTVSLDGARVIITVTKEGKTSTVTQEPARIHMKAEEIALEADRLRLTSKDGTWESDTLAHKAKDDLRIECQGPITGSAQKDLKLEGLGVSITARVEARLAGQKVALAGQAALQAEAMSVGVKGTTVKIEGTMIDVKGGGLLNCESAGQTTLKGAMCQIQGALITLG